MQPECSYVVGRERHWRGSAPKSEFPRRKVNKGTCQCARAAAACCSSCCQAALRTRRTIWQHVQKMASWLLGCLRSISLWYISKRNCLILLQFTSLSLLTPISLDLPTWDSHWGSSKRAFTLNAFEPNRWRIMSTIFVPVGLDGPNVGMPTVLKIYCFIVSLAHRRYSRAACYRVEFPLEDRSWIRPIGRFLSARILAQIDHDQILSALEGPQSLP